MDKLDMFQSRFGVIDKFGWRDLERISADAGTQFTLMEFKEDIDVGNSSFFIRVKKFFIF